MTPTLPWVGSLHQSRGVQGAHRRGDPQPDVSFSFTTVPPPTTLADVRGVSHISPLNGQNVSGVEGIVTARRTAGGRGVWIQDPTPDANVATSDAVFVFLNAAPVARIGDLVRASGTVSEFRAGGDPDNLTITQITSSNPNVTVLSSGNPLPHRRCSASAAASRPRRTSTTTTPVTSRPVAASTR